MVRPPGHQGPDTNINLHVFSAGCVELERMVGSASRARRVGGMSGATRVDTAPGEPYRRETQMNDLFYFRRPA